MKLPSFNLQKIKDLEVNGKKRTLKGFWALLFILSGAFMAGWYLYTSGFGVVSTESNRGFYLLFTSVLVFLLFPATKRSPKDRPSVFDLIFVVLVSVSMVYWMTQYMSYAINRVSAPNNWDLIMGIIGILMVLETSRRAIGMVIPILAIIFIAQLYFGPYLPGKMAHAGMSVRRILEFTYNTQEALFGVVTATFATFVFPFMIFGAFLERSGAADFFMELGKALTGRWRGGPAKISTVTSALFGSISGSSVANVVATGTFTIPMMKKTGFKPKTAAAIEAISSTGGQIMPPIMGAGVFILATITGTSYLTIAMKNIIPALLFFAFLLMMVDLGALRQGLKGLPPKDVPKTSEVLKKGWFFFLPIVVILGFLFMGFTPELAAFWGIVSSFVVSWIRKENRMYPKDVFYGLVKGAQSNMSAGSAIGSLGIIIGGIVLAGLGLKFSALLVELAGGSLIITMLMVLVISIIIGMGSTTTGSYIILSVVAAPALITLGVPTVAAHLVVFYGACLSNITPPVCVSVFAASAIAQSEPMETGISALKYGMALILLPFGFVYYPGLLMNASLIQVVYVVVFIFFGLIAMAMALQGADFLNHSIKNTRRIFFGVAAVLILFPSIIWLNVVGLALLIIGWIPSIKVYRQSKLEDSAGMNAAAGS